MKYILFLVLIVATFAFAGAVVVWCLNTLFLLDIPYTPETIGAAVLLAMLFTSNSISKRD